MSISHDAVLMRIFIGESDRSQGKPLYRVIVEEARKAGMAGATVLRGPVGFGHSSRLHTEHILRLSGDLPLIVELVDETDKIEAFREILDGIMGSGLVTLEPVTVIRYGTETGDDG